MVLAPSYTPSARGEYKPRTTPRSAATGSLGGASALYGPQDIDTSSLVNLSSELPARPGLEDLLARLVDLESEVAALKLRLLKSPISRDNGQLRVNGNLMVPHQVYEVSTGQGPLQLVKEEDGSIRVIEVYEVDEEPIEEDAR